MEVKLEKVIVSINSFNVLSDLKLPVAVAFKISKIGAEVNGVTEIFNKKREEIIKLLEEKRKELGLKEKDELPKEEITAVNDEMRALLDEVVNLDCSQLRVADLGTAEIESSHLLALSWLITE